jgi:hypothetical protein
MGDADPSKKMTYATSEYYDVGWPSSACHRHPNTRTEVACIMYEEEKKDRFTKESCTTKT